VQFAGADSRDRTLDPQFTFVNVPIVPSSQDDYRQLLKQYVTPALHGEGLEGSNGKYQLRSDSVWALLDFQKSAGNSAHEVKFTVNLLVVAKKSWNVAREKWTFYPAKPSANRVWQEVEWQTRIGRLLPDGLDHWWWLRDGDEVSRVGPDVVEALTVWGLPALKHQVSLIES